MDSPFVGMLCAFGFTYAPQGWAQCNGQTLPVMQQQALYHYPATCSAGCLLANGLGWRVPRVECPRLLAL